MSINKDTYKINFIRIFIKSIFYENKTHFKY